MTPRDADATPFRPAWWLRNAHAQTIWGKVARAGAKHRTVVECLPSPDGDNLELHHLESQEPAAVRVLLFHGLEGSPRSHYVTGVFSEAARRGWGATLLLFRGCGSAPNVARRFYHSGETSDPAHVFRILSTRWPRSHWVLASVSLGGNVMLKWLGEQGAARDPRIVAAAAVSVPFDLEAGARRIASGASRIYDRSFLRSLRRKAMAKLARYPDLFDPAALARAKNVFEFDDTVTAPVHGFANARDYYEKSSSMRFLPAIRVPTLLLSAADDPFMPPEVLDRARATAATNPCIELEFTARGGHVGFVSGALPWKARYYAEWRIFQFFDRVLERVDGRSYD